MNDDDLPTPGTQSGAPSAPALSADQALALDYALGILVDPLLGEAARRCDVDEAFGELVAHYRDVLSKADDGLEVQTPVAPSARVWDAIAARTAPGADD